MSDLILDGAVVGILITMIALLTAFKKGVNEIITGLEAISEALDRLARKND
jgi:hypothetical protein